MGMAVLPCRQKVEIERTKEALYLTSTPMIPTTSTESQCEPISPIIGSSRVGYCSSRYIGLSNDTMHNQVGVFHHKCNELEVWEGSQELLNTDDEELNPEKTVVEETDLEDTDVNMMVPENK